MKYTLALVLMFGAVVVRADEPTALPKVVLVGDSIRLGYTATVTKALEGKAVVVSPRPNGGDSANVLKNLEAWVLREKPAVVHLNCGIHDTKRFRETGRFQVSPDEYESNLREIVKRIRDETDAVVLFATSTPILDDRAAAARKGRDYELLNASIDQYNTIGRKVMKELDVPVDDLNALLSKPDDAEKLIGRDGVHPKPAGYERLGKQVAAFVSGHLAP